MSLTEKRNRLRLSRYLKLALLLVPLIAALPLYETWRLSVENEIKAKVEALNSRGRICAFTFWNELILPPLLEGKTIDGDPYLGPKTLVSDWHIVADLALSQAEAIESQASERADCIIELGLSRTILACMCGNLIYAKYALV